MINRIKNLLRDIVSRTHNLQEAERTKEESHNDEIQRSQDKSQDIKGIGRILKSHTEEDLYPFHIHVDTDALSLITKEVIAYSYRAPHKEDIRGAALYDGITVFQKNKLNLVDTPEFIELLTMYGDYIASDHIDANIVAEGIIHSGEDVFIVSREYNPVLKNLKIIKPKREFKDLYGGHDHGDNTSLPLTKKDIQEIRERAEIDDEKAIKSGIFLLCSRRPTDDKKIPLEQLTSEPLIRFLFRDKIEELADVMRKRKMNQVKTDHLPDYSYYKDPTQASYSALGYILSYDDFVIQEQPSPRLPGFLHGRCLRALEYNRRHLEYLNNPIWIWNRDISRK